MPIINSILDSDKYKFSMQQLIFHQHPNVTAEIEFKCRDKDVDLSPYSNQILKQIQHLSSLSLTPEEYSYLTSKEIYKKDYLNFLSKYKFNLNDLIFTHKPFSIKVKGLWKNIILWEIPILSIVSEVYFNNTYPMSKLQIIDGQKRLLDKIQMILELNDQTFKFTDFGTRRRRAFLWQKFVVQKLSKFLPVNFLGTSNVHLAHILGLEDSGTMAHEFLQAYQVLAPLEKFQKIALEDWFKEYSGNLGIALTDVIGFDAFLEEFDENLAKEYIGLRHDSGCPYAWGDKAIKFYEKLNINPKTKTLIFSDGLTMASAIEIHKYFKGRIKTQINGIGTHLTNDFSFKPLNIVMKMTSCNDLPVAKLSDSPGKEMCKDQNFINKLKKIRNLK
ncbi:MAG: nicotinate phosphoribosyltransferase [Ignavibacteria bacterium]